MLIIDDHPIIRYGIRHILDAEDDIEVVGELEQMDLIASVLSQLAPDIVLLDLELGDCQGVEALQKLRDASPEQRVVIYTSHDEASYVIASAELGIDGYVLKSGPKRTLVSAVRQVYSGGTAIEAIVAKKLMTHMNKRSSLGDQPHTEISPREKEVLAALATGLTNRDIAESLFISESTVKFHVHAILSKLDATNRTEAVSKAVQLGIVSIETATPPN
jgi:DNA-binding NarL/FixJ family response regulator